MNLNSLLNAVLSATQKQTAQKGGRSDNLLGSLGGSALAAGLVSMLLKKKNTGSLAKVGSMAALGMLAYKAYQGWQQKQSAQNAQTAQNVPQEADFAAAATGTAAENHGRIILRTMIAAAASDGLIDEKEKQLIQQESGDDAATQRWLAAEFANPADLAQIAADIGSNRALAAEAYLAARIVCDELSRKEIVFLAQLAAALQLDEQLVEQLESQLGL